MDARHWNQLEQLLEEGRLEMLLIMVYNYLRYEDPSKWNKLEKHVVNPAGYLNKNIGQKISMLAVCKSMVTSMHSLRTAAPDTAQHVDGRTLQYMFDNLEQPHIASCCEYLREVFDHSWPLRCENPRMLLHAKVKGFVAQVQAQKDRSYFCQQQQDAQFLAANNQQVLYQQQQQPPPSIYSQFQPLVHCR
jgi:hypothetical protein